MTILALLKRSAVLTTSNVFAKKTDDSFSQVFNIKWNFYGTRTAKNFARIFNERVCNVYLLRLCQVDWLTIDRTRLNVIHVHFPVTVIELLN